MNPLRHYVYGSRQRVPLLHYSACLVYVANPLYSYGGMRLQSCMPKFQQALCKWPSDDFKQSLKNELETLEAGVLPLEKGVSQGGMVDDSNITVTVLNVRDSGIAIEAKLGVFFTEVVICCGCGDDPMPVNAYCEMQCLINKDTADAEFQVLEE